MSGSILDNLDISEEDEDIEDQDSDDEEEEEEEEAHRQEEEGEEEEVTSKSKPKPVDQSKYCVHVEGHDLHKCTKCVYMHKYPSKVLRHFRYKHEKFCPYRCGYCNFASVESPKIRRHCIKVHTDEVVKIIDISSAVEAMEQGNEETALPEGNVAAEETVDRAERAAAHGVQKDLEDMFAKYIVKGSGNIQTCLICAYRQEGASSLKRHLFAVHLNYHPYKCKYCNFDAVERNKVIKHLEKSHNGLKMKIVRSKFRGTLPEVGDLPPLVGGHTMVGEEEGTGLMISNVATVEPESERTGRTETASDSGYHDASHAESLQSGSDFGMQSEESRDTWTPVQPVTIKPEPDYEDDIYGQMPSDMYMTDNDPMYDSGFVKPEPQDRATVSLGTITPAAPYIAASPSPTSKKKKAPTKEGTGINKKCKYCTYSTVWNLGDVKTHVIVTHLKKLPYGCKFCSHQSRDKRRLKEHCEKHGKRDIPGFRYMYNDYADILEIRRGANEVHVGIKSCDNDEDLQRASRMRRVDLEQMALEFDAAEAEERAAMGLPPQSQAAPIEIQDEPLDLSRARPPPLARDSSTTLAEMNQIIGALSPTIQSPTASLSPLKIPGVTSPEGFRTPKLTEKHIQCTVCGYVHFDRYKIKIHILAKHIGLKPYMCSICNFGDFIFHRVRDHVKDAHPGLNASLRRCIQEKEKELQKLITGADLRKMPASQMPKPRMLSSSFKPWGCGHCGQYRAYSKAKIRYHSIAKHKGLPFRYIQYEERNKTPSTASAHLAALAAHTHQSKGSSQAPSSPAISMPAIKAAPTGGIKCQHCGVTVESQERMQGHIRFSHPNIGIFQCPYCPSRIRYKAKMKMHQIRKHPELPLKFNLVHMENTSTVTNDSLIEAKRPKLNVPDINKAKYQRSSDIMIDHYTCKACVFITKDQFAMRNHAQGHLNYRPYKCPYCNYGNVKSFPIKLHVAKHHPAQPVSFQLAKDAQKEIELRELYTRPLQLSKKMPAVHISLDHHGTVPKQEPRELDELGFDLPSERLGGEVHLEQVEFVPIPPDIPGQGVDDIPLEPGATNHIAKPRAKPSATRPFKCKLCGHWSQNHTAIKRHLMWELRYLPYHCQHCSYKDVHGSGIESHCDRKHKGKISAPVIRRNVQREEHIKELIDESRMRPVVTGSIQSEVSPQGLPVVRSPHYSKPIVLVPDKQDGVIRLRKCKICSFTSQKAKTLLNHWVRHGPKRFGCTYCSFGGHYPYEIVNHCHKFHPKQKPNHKRLQFVRGSMNDDMEILEGDDAKAEVERQKGLHQLPSMEPQAVKSGNLEQGNYVYRTPVKGKKLAMTCMHGWWWCDIVLKPINISYRCIP